MKILSKRKFTKLALASLSLVAIGALAISCSASTSGRYDTSNTTSVRLAQTFSTSGPQSRALKALVDLYNEQQKDTEGFLPVEIVQINGGYSASAQNVTTRLNARSTNDLPNLVLNFPSLLAEITRQGMNLELGINLNDRYDSHFLQGNDISGLDGTKANLVPFGLSGVVKAIDGPVVSFMLEEALQAGATIKASDDTAVRAFILEDKTDYGFIENGSPAFTGGGFGKPAANSWNGFEITLDDLTSFSGLMRLGTKVFDTFSGTQNKTDNIIKARAFLGVDSMTNLIYQLMRSINNGAEEGDLFSLDANGRIDYNAFLNNPQSKQYKDFEALYNTYLKPALSRGMLWIGGDGEFASNFFKNHSMAFSLSSTAGFNFNTVAIDRKAKIYTSNKDANANLSSDVLYELSAAKASDTNYIAGVRALGSRFNNGIVRFGTAKDENNRILSSPDSTRSQRFYIIPQDQATQDTIDSMISDQAVDFNKGVMVAEGTEAFKIAQASFDGLVRLGKFYDATSRGVTSDFPGEEKTLWFLSASAFTTSSGSDAKEKATLQVGELNVDVLTHYDQNTPGLVYRQGPSLIGVHSNDTGDRATRLFIAWLTDPNKKYNITIPGRRPNDQGQVFENATPQEAFSLSASYLIPYKGFTTDADLKTQITKTKNKFLIKSFDYFSQAVDPNNHLNVYSERVDSISDNFRTTLESVLFSSKNSLTNPSAVFPNFEAFIRDFKRSFQV